MISHRVPWKKQKKENEKMTPALVITSLLPFLCIKDLARYLSTCSLYHDYVCLYNARFSFYKKSNEQAAAVHDKYAQQLASLKEANESEKKLLELKQDAEIALIKNKNIENFSALDKKYAEEKCN